MLQDKNVLLQMNHKHSMLSRSGVQFFSMVFIACLVVRFAWKKWKYCQCELNSAQQQLADHYDCAATLCHKIDNLNSCFQEFVEQSLCHCYSPTALERPSRSMLLLLDCDCSLVQFFLWEIGNIPSSCFSLSDMIRLELRFPLSTHGNLLSHLGLPLVGAN